MVLVDWDEFKLSDNRKNRNENLVSYTITSLETLLFQSHFLIQICHKQFTGRSEPILLTIKNMLTNELLIQWSVMPSWNWGIGTRLFLETLCVILKGRSLVQTANNLDFQSFLDIPACCKYFIPLIERKYICTSICIQCASSLSQDNSVLIVYDLTKHGGDHILNLSA